MTGEQAAVVIGWLMATTTGWNDDSTEAYAIAMREWDDFEAAVAAARTVSQTWTERSRPPLAILRSAYNVEQERRRYAYRRVLVEAAPVNPAEGRRLAAAAYEQECERAGRRPNWTLFNSLIQPTEPTGGTNHEQAD